MDLLIKGGKIVTATATFKGRYRRKRQQIFCHWHKPKTGRKDRSS